MHKEEMEFGKAGDRNKEDLIYGGADTLSADQIAAVEFFGAGSTLELESDAAATGRVIDGRANRAPTDDFEGRTAEQIATADKILALKTPDAEAALAEKSRAEKDNDMKVILLEKKIVAQLAGDTAEDAKLEGMLAALDAHIAERGAN